MSPLLDPVRTLDRPPWVDANHFTARRMLVFSGAGDPEQALANDACQDADCEGLVGVNVYGSGDRLVITVAH